MPVNAGSKRSELWIVLQLLLPLASFWLVLLARIPYSFSGYFYAYSPGLFLALLGLFYLAFRSPRRYGLLPGLGLTMLLFALALSYQWTSGFSDNFIIGGLLPYKDSKNFYYDASLILNGLPSSSDWVRPLFPGLLASLLVFAGQNLRLVLAILVQLTAAGLYLSTVQIRRSMGEFAAALYFALMYFYIQPFIGYALSELMGFAVGCIAFVLLWRAARDLAWLDLALGLVTLMVAISSRAGAFLIFPVLVLWFGWIFRGSKLFSVKSAAAAALVILVSYLAINTAYSRLVGIPPGAVFSNFSFSLYGQVRGGIGWHKAIDELATRNPSVVYRAAFEFFLAHPLSFFIAAAKSYRDFFLPGDLGIFPFTPRGEPAWLAFPMWAAIMSLLVWSIARMVKTAGLNLSSLLLAGLAGLLLSIPFLPPIDGGTRFYASTTPFFFALTVVAAGRFPGGVEANAGLEGPSRVELRYLRAGSSLLMGLAMVIPIGLYYLSRAPTPDVPSCALNQASFAIRANPDSYLDLVPPGGVCGTIPAVCLSDFERNGAQKSIDDFYQELLSLAQSSASGVRITPALNLQDSHFYYFVQPLAEVSARPAGQIATGCAVVIRTENQSIYWVEAWDTSGK